MIRGGAILLGAALASSAAVAGDVEVIVRGAAPGEGQVMISVFIREADWMKSPAGEATAPIDAEGEARAIIAAPDAPQVGVAVIWDRDGDGALDTNILGIPTEPFGFSRNASATFGPPDWAEAAAPYGAAARIEIDLAEARR